MSGKTADSTNQDQDKKIDGMNTESKQHLLPGVYQYYFNTSLLLT